jgi:23S rRNA G2445 N2-methylase RlmL
MLMAANIFEYDTIFDVFTGYGTIPFEACRLLNREPSDKYRNFRYVEANSIRQPIVTANPIPQIIASDIDPHSLEIAQQNNPFGSKITFLNKDFFNLNKKDFADMRLLHNRSSQRMDCFESKARSGLAMTNTEICNILNKGKVLICSNPPWGKRLQGKSVKDILKKARELSKYADVVMLLPAMYLSKRHERLFTIRSGEILVSSARIL